MLESIASFVVGVLEVHFLEKRIKLLRVFLWTFLFCAVAFAVDILISPHAGEHENGWGRLLAFSCLLGTAMGLLMVGIQHLHRRKQAGPRSADRDGGPW